MTLIAGILSRKPGSKVLSSVCDNLHRLISRDPNDQRIVIEDTQSYFVKVNLAAFTDDVNPVNPDGSLTIFTGEPLLDRNEETGHGPDGDAAAIHNAFSLGDTSVLQKANGVFSAVHYQPSTGTVHLTADKLGLRPLYYFIDNNYLIFASVLRILEEIQEIPKRVDLRAVTQIVGIGYALGDRTPYADIKMVRPAEVVTINANNVSRQKYWNWDKIQISSAPEADLLSELYRLFNLAIARRIRNDKTTGAYLSGGLDSRCIVAALGEQNVNVHTFNFARPNTQDQIFGLHFANAIGSIHQEVPKLAGDIVPDYSTLMAKAWSASGEAERPGIVWSGEGGSVALGHVHLTEEIVELIRKGQIDEVIDIHLHRESAEVSPKIFRTEYANDLIRTTKDDIKNELSNFHCDDPARNFYLHLLLNDQHRKLAKHFENIDLHRLEFHLPFFDSPLLEFIISIPIDMCLRHRFYVKWLSLFPSAVTNVPWQVYPGHQPCPVAAPKGLDYQWADKYQSTEHAARKRQVMQQASEMLRSTDFPKEILNKNNLRLAAWIHATGLRDYQYLIGPAHTYHLYWQKCNGNYVL